MTLFQNKYRIESTRLKGYDYSSDGLYFVTICTNNRELFFGDVIGKYHYKFIEDEEVILSVIGHIANKFWSDIPKYFPFVELNEYVVMPNHIHGIIGINKK